MSPPLVNKPFSQACENNKHAISLTLKSYVELGGSLLEIGSGTGQHGCHMSSVYPNLRWQTSDQADYLAGINAWVCEANRDNFLAPIQLDINTASWAGEPMDFVYASNVVHIMSLAEVDKLFSFIPSALKSGGLFFLYGPFNYEGMFTSESNAQFNDWLKAQAPHRAIRDFETINALAQENGLQLVNDHEMPANNRLLVWKKSP